MGQKIRHCWLSLSAQARWQYVLLTEPDLIVNTRPDALPLLGHALRQGGVLAPHRLQPIPHASDFPFDFGEDRGAGAGGTDLTSTSTTTTNTTTIKRRTQNENTE